MIPLRAAYNPGIEIPRSVPVPEELQGRIGRTVVPTEIAPLPESKDVAQSSGAIAVAKTASHPVLTI